MTLLDDESQYVNLPAEKKPCDVCGATEDTEFVWVTVEDSEKSMWLCHDCEDLFLHEGYGG